MLNSIFLICITLTQNLNKKPEISEVGVPECLFGGYPLIWIVGAHLVYELNAVLGSVGDQLLDTRALLRRKIEIYTPVSTVNGMCLEILKC